MNKYIQSVMEALDFVKDSVRCLGCVGSCNECEYFLAIEKIENAIERLGELIEKETPKIPVDIPSGHIPKHGKCPNCGSFVVLTCSNDRCRVCGQRLDWGENDE